MLTDWQELLEHLIPSFKKQREAEALALKAEMVVRELNDLPPANLDDRDVVGILNSICLLLERFQDHLDLREVPEKSPTRSIEITKTEKAPPPPEVPLVPPIVRATPEEKPSATAQELIRLRDWVLLAKSRETQEQTSPQVLDAIYQQLGKVLEKENITSIEDTESFDYKRQQVISTEVTDDPEKDDCICDTVRPGYLFQSKLIRPQEVIVYTYDSSIAASETS